MPALPAYRRAPSFQERFMLTRRTLIAASLFAAAPALAQAPAPSDPAAILTAIYTRAAKGKGDGGATFVTGNKAG